MAIVAYLLGAGASANCIPVVNKMAEQMKLLIDDLAFYYPKGINESSAEHHKRKDFNKIVKILENIKVACDEHYSIDTYAKKLYLTNRSDFFRIKLDLCLYFTLTQIVKLPDKRYDNFFSSIMTDRRRLPNKIKIISWNYDYQLEKSFFEFNNTLDLETCQLTLGVHSPSSHRDYDDFKGRFNVIKLNGSAKITSNNHKGFLVNLINKTKKEQIYQTVQRYLEITETDDSYECELKFAWESENYGSLFRKSHEDLSSIEVLVVIGYSFPFFNRQVDKDLFYKMESLNTVYIQDLAPEDIHETMKEFFYFMNVNVVYKKNINQFVFPRELDIT